LLKKLGLAAVIAAAAAAYAAPTASAVESTTLCWIGTETTCPESKRVTAMAIEAEDPVFLSTLGNVLCELAFFALAPEPGTAPEVIHVVGSQWHECTLAGGPCAVKDLAFEHLDLQRTQYNLGTVTWLGHEAEIACTGFTCKYGGKFTLQAEGANHTAGANFGMVTANGTPIAKIGGAFFCPKEVKLHALFEFELGAFITY